MHVLVFRWESLGGPSLPPGNDDDDNDDDYDGKDETNDDSTTITLSAQAAPGRRG